MCAPVTACGTPICASSSRRRGEIEASRITGDGTSFTMIRMMAEEAVGAIELLREHHARQRMRQCELRGGPPEMAARHPFGCEAIRPADEEREVAPIAHAHAEPGGQRARRHLRPTLIERDDVVVLANCSEQAFALC